MNWLGYALLSALAAGLTAILAKLSVEDIPPNLATAVRTVFILVFAWLFAYARGEVRGLNTISPRGALFLALSAAATAISWLAYFKALQLAPASRVAPIDKLSLPITIALAYLVLGEPLSVRVLLGAALMVTGAVLTVPP